MTDTPSLKEQIAERLQALMLHQTHFMIVERIGSPFYVQFMPTKSGDLIAEAVSNEYLDDERPLGH